MKHLSAVFSAVLIALCVVALLALTAAMALGGIWLTVHIAQSMGWIR